MCSLFGLAMTTAVTTVLLISGASTWSSEATAASVCYESLDSDAAHRLDVKFHSLLVRRQESRETGFPVQWTYSAHGKYVTTETFNLVEGTILVLKGEGAWMSITGFNCRSGEDSATPEQWLCQPGVVLSRIDPAENQLCSFALPPPPTD